MRSAFDFAEFPRAAKWEIELPNKSVAGLAVGGGGFLDYLPGTMFERLQALFSDDGSAGAEFSEEWDALIAEHVPLVLRLSEDERNLLRQRVAAFMASVRFEGCGGLELDEGMMLAVAAQACLLVLHREGKPYPELKVIYLYPSTFSSVMKSTDGLGIVTEGEVTRLGESWEHGTVVLAWDSVARGAQNLFDARNVTFHEFAHQLDHEDGATDGAPALPSRDAYRSWARVFSSNYADFLERLEEGKKTLIDAYGATNPAEFFAVATETFFEKPERLAKIRPQLFEALTRYYRLDPRDWQRTED